MIALSALVYALSVTVDALSVADIVGNSQVSTLAGAAKKLKLDTALVGLKDATIFAPVDAAFAKVEGLSSIPDSVLTSIVTYHVATKAFSPSADSASSQKVFLPSLAANSTLAVTVEAKAASVSVYSPGNLGSAKVLSSLKTDDGSNVVVHLIDTVLSPPVKISAAAKLGGLTALIDALNATGLVDTVDGLSGVTVFAPTNAAFEAISSVVKTLSKDQIAAILKLHIVPSTLYSTDIVSKGPNIQNIPTLNGQTLTATVSADGVFVSGAGNKTPAKAVKTDLLVASNSVVHVIDAVLLPSSSTNVITNGARGTSYSAVVGVLGFAAAFFLMQ
jgi:transforming growth factor-beta-induced protein